jgi:D-glycero-D-manno-heptose 1,7-bisphosphate phosphatase
MTRAAFLDRDGVVNRKAPEGQYIIRWEDLEILPGVARAIAEFNEAGFRVIIVSNQRCVAKGLITESQLEALHTKMCETLSAAGAAINAIYYCPHDLHPPCDCRKPRPGMLREAAREHGIDLDASWMIGDTAMDVEAGQRAGCKTAIVADNRDAANSKADVWGTSLLDVTHQILQQRDPFRPDR